MQNNKSITAPYFILINLVFLFFTLHTYMFAVELQDWYIENILVLVFIALLIIQRYFGKFKFSTTSYLCIYLFLALHEWGAQYCYSSHPLGYYLQNVFHLQRNAYDRLVHTSFGFLLYYPLRQILHYRYKVQLHKIPLRALDIILCLASIFELIEFAVANYIFPNELGKTYVGTQGDVWDAQKDIAVALIGCALAIALHAVYKKVAVKIFESNYKTTV